MAEETGLRSKLERWPKKGPAVDANLQLVQAARAHSQPANPGGHFSKKAFPMDFLWTIYSICGTLLACVVVFMNLAPFVIVIFGGIYQLGYNHGKRDAFIHCSRIDKSPRK